MQNDTAENARPDGAPIGEPANDVGFETPGAPEPADDRVAALEAERTDLKDKLLRTLADMENMRRRTERELADIRTYGVSNFARDMLTVADNIRRALESVPSDARE